MADRFTAIRSIPVRAIRFGLAGLLLSGFLLMSGCQAVTMPDMSDFKLNIFEEKPVVAIKSGYSKVNIRSTPSTEIAPVATLKGGDKVKLHEEQGNWLKVTFYDTAGQEQEGWVYKYLVEGYSKPAQKVESSSANIKEVQPEADTYEIEQETNEQELPKSESVSPL